MQWTEITIQTTHIGMDAVCGLLDYMGFEGYVIDDEQEYSEFLRDNTDYWDYVDADLLDSMRGLSQVKLYVESDTSAQKLSELRTALEKLKGDTSADLGSLEIRYAEVADEDWENSWKDYYEPIEIANLLINPCWKPVPPDSGKVVVNLDPGMMFGTGSHASTRMCLEVLTRYIKGGEMLLDLGCGSGILSIAALMLGAKEVVGVDIDPKAEKITRDNAALNGIYADRFTALTGDVLKPPFGTHEKYDIITANIVADIIIPLAPKAAGLLRKGGLFICSGILNTRASEVGAAVSEAGFNIIEQKELDDWVMLAADY